MMQKNELETFSYPERNEQSLGFLDLFVTERPETTKSLYFNEMTL